VSCWLGYDDQLCQTMLDIYNTNDGLAHFIFSLTSEFSLVWDRPMMFIIINVLLDLYTKVSPTCRNWLTASSHNHWQLSKVIWKKASSPTCHPLWFRWICPILLQWFLVATWVSSPNGISIASAVFAQYIRATDTQTETDTQTTLRAMSL